MLDPIKEHFSKMGKRSWKVRKARLLAKKVETVGKKPSVRLIAKKDAKTL